MDHLFLQRLVEELRPALINRRVRTVVLWEGGLALGLSGRPAAYLVLSFLPESPGLFLGVAPPSPTRRASPRFEKLLPGSRLTRIEATTGDRVLRFEWQRRRPSGGVRRVDMYTEWLGSRAGAFLVDPSDVRVLEVFSRGRPRVGPGEPYQLPVRPAANASELPEPATFRAQLEAWRSREVGEDVALMRASGFGPALAGEIQRLVGAGRAEVDAYAEIRRKLTSEMTPVLLRNRSAEGGKGGALRQVSCIRLGERERWTQARFATFNEAAAAYICETASLMESRRLWTRLSGALGKRLRKLRTLVVKLDAEVRRVEEPNALRRRGELLLAGLHNARRGSDWVEVPDHYRGPGVTVRIPIDPRYDLPRNADLYFRRARKAERSRVALAERKAHVEEEILYLETLEMELEESASQRSELEALRVELLRAGVIKETEGASPRSTPAPRLSARRFRSSRGDLILVGRSGRSNDELTFSVARPEDLWLHADGAAGAHVIVRCDDAMDLPAAVLEEAAALAAYHSKARGSGSVDVIVTPRKHVRKIAGAPPGTVRVARYRTIRVRPSQALNVVAAEDEGAGEGTW